ncbi:MULTISPECIES: DNA-directed RNA polymerase subunit beta [Cytobacillus]|uniref:DNA-directed RNA polymerase subunit beta n=1 Tax=Cytobacillus stercorigallinarum TaxID=2762240 RepID=A0ABR8QTU5_9BACI|nr:DNA-directed RNA polymerase subunit beta [Cytobacillus stercorigallinarum]MBD7938692.1 DNA-directed RNA polymerase subunit beta [Cytobacillus stercorigallinarum]
MSLNNEQDSSTRITKQKAQHNSTTTGEEKTTVNRIRVRLIPIWLRIIIVLVLLVICIIAGATFGYSVLGDGQATDIFKKETWMHMIDLVNKEN